MTDLTKIFSNFVSQATLQNFNDEMIFFSKMSMIDWCGVGLIVHGPLQATYLLRAAEKLMGKPVKSFTHKVMAPVFADSEYMVGVDKMDDGSASCWGATKEFGVTMRAEAKF